MKASLILSCLVLLFIIHGTFCDGHQDAQNTKINERTKRSHENDCQKRTPFENKPNKPDKPISRNIVKQKPKTTTKTVNKSKLSINERNEPKNLRTINHILEEISTIAHNQNETKGVQKIRHLVDEINNLDNMKSSAKVDHVKSSIKTGNEAKLKETTKLTQESKTVVRKVPVNDATQRGHVENRGSMNINVNKSLSTNGRRFNKELTKQADETTTTRMPNENLIEIKEHKFEEELLRSPCTRKYDTYNLNYGQNYNAGPIPNSNILENYSSYSSNHPFTTYSNYERNNRYYYANWQYYGSNGYYYANSPNPLNQQTYQTNGDYTRYRKTWLDKDTIISTRNPNELGEIINEDRDETNIRSPEFYGKYYSVKQKQYSNNNEALKNMLYYVNPYQCSK